MRGGSISFKNIFGIHKSNIYPPFIFNISLYTCDIVGYIRNGSMISICISCAKWKHSIDFTIVQTILTICYFHSPFKSANVKFNCPQRNWILSIVLFIYSSSFYYFVCSVCFFMLFNFRMEQYYVCYSSGKLFFNKALLLGELLLEITLKITFRYAVLFSFAIIYVSN